MNRFVRTEIVSPVAVLTIENPPVNALGDGVWEAIDEAVAAAAANDTVSAIILMGGGTTFVAGADINVFKALKSEADALERTARSHAMLRRLEDTPKPLIAAIHGHALGGGLELAMACHFRIATMDAKLGQPEVLLGIMPGAGGTQRLPRLVGTELALKMCTDGKSIAAPDAARAGLVDHIVAGDLKSSALGYARAKAVQRTTRKARDITMTAEQIASGLQACAAMRATLAKTARGLRAPFAAVDAIEAGLQQPFDDGANRERAIFAACVVSTESRSLRHLFFAEREAARLPADLGRAQARELRQAAVVGGGTMGAGIAVAYVNAGLPVVLKEVDDAACERAMASIRKVFDSAMAKGRLDACERDRRLTMITPTTDFDDLAHVDIVVEAVFEDLALKQQTFAALGRVTQDDCVLATNTSTLDVDAIAAASGRPSQVVGHHFFSPANIMTLLEIVRGRETSGDVLATSLKLAKHLGKTPVIVGNGFGFVANRMLGYYLREALLLVEEGASVAQVDGVMTAFGLPVGPFAMEDIAGIDVGARIRQHRARTGQGWADGPRSPLPDRLFEMGRYGQKTGVGWYRYEAGSRERIVDPVVDGLAAEVAQARGLTRRPIADDDILGRIMAALANEGFRVLEQQLAQRPGDIDVIYCHGFGFPRYRGGPMFYADTLGLPVLLDRINGYRAQYGDHWTAAPLLERLVREGRALYDDAAQRPG